MKKTLHLEAIDPIEIYGAGNRILNEFCSYFPKLKVTARGHELILDGKEEDIALFGTKFDELVERRHHKMNLTVYDVEDIFDGESSPDQYRLQSDAVIVHGTDGRATRARNANQQEMVKGYFENDLIFATGPAGTGKTYIAIALAVRALKNREIRRIILTRPAVEAGERLGFLPGDMEEKINPYLRPLYDALGDMLGVQGLQQKQESGAIEIAPLAFMRGRTLNDAFLILDEAQNTTREQMKMFLTRLGFGSRAVITGDVTQIDLPPLSVRGGAQDGAERSGLIHALRVLKDVRGTAFHQFQSADVVRHPLVGRIVEAYDRYEKN